MLMGEARAEGLERFSSRAGGALVWLMLRLEKGEWRREYSQSAYMNRNIISMSRGSVVCSSMSLVPGVCLLTLVSTCFEP